jgi:hypothetical protein
MLIICLEDAILEKLKLAEDEKKKNVRKTRKASNKA